MLYYDLPDLVNIRQRISIEKVVFCVKLIKSLGKLLYFQKSLSQTNEFQKVLNFFVKHKQNKRTTSFIPIETNTIQNPNPIIVSKPVQIVALVKVQQ